MNNTQHVREFSIDAIMQLNEKHGERFKRYLNSVYKVLNELKEGESFDIEKNIKTDIIPQFMKCATLYISESRGEYSFNASCTKITHNIKPKPKKNQLWVNRIK